VEELVELRHQLDGALKELQLQFQRIAQIQPQLDSLLFQPKRESHKTASGTTNTRFAALLVGGIGRV
jgi:hypothetical protein